jgi:predicted Zn-dependent peptidase
MTKSKRGRYTLEFKQEAARLVESGQSQAAVARSLGVVEQALGNWVKQLRAGTLKGATSKPQVVTVETNSLVGGDETPPGFPGMAHAQEHMAFRGCAGLTADQTSAIYAQLGGQNNADTQQNIPQYGASRRLRP